MTQMNGEQPAPTNVGGVPGAWTVTLSVDSSRWGNYTGGGTMVDYNGNYALRIARFAALSRARGPCISSESLGRAKHWAESDDGDASGDHHRRGSQRGRLDALGMGR